jgi:hypothetical protein
MAKVYFTAVFATALLAGAIACLATDHSPGAQLHSGL